MSHLKVGSVVIHCHDFDTMFAFWREALGYEPREEPEPDWVVLRDPTGIGVNVSIGQVEELRPNNNNLHFDLYSDDPEAEIERLVALGARRHERMPEPGEDFVVLRDPEDNLFCVIDTRES
jgi:catechol 2,3-dioxygenase-like lactoylglutathione lyase family enzyme